MTFHAFIMPLTKLPFLVSDILRDMQPGMNTRSRTELSLKTSISGNKSYLNKMLP